MKIIIAPDKFKGSLTSMQACEAIRDGILKGLPDATIHLFPMADGGDGFDEVLKFYLNTKTIYCETVDPLMHPLNAAYQLNPVSGNAIISLAAASGLILLNQDERNPLVTSTYGSGLMIMDAVANGANNIILGLGGSATNDAGLGILYALGFQLRDKKGNDLSPVGENLISINTIIPPRDLPKISFQIACDVRNFLFGSDGAAFVYAPQKGANEESVNLLDKGLRHIAKILLEQTCIDVSTIPGVGAAGGVAAGLMSYFDCSIESGASMVIDESNIIDQVKDADLVITGEGKLDSQSMSGKVIDHIVQIANQFHKPVIAFCGIADFNATDLNQTGLSAIYQILNDDIDATTAMANAAMLLTDLAAHGFQQYIKA